ncbi:DUF6706 family protein [uncultured Bacteroides sp.]|uniref:DUF6706 family protein n=1 Tax=uncultured Bacteroides sp. TaxID=162156 RepID=UPI002AAC0ECB|nr:DUF6706 family protein [uncultured Bacteroides sp.]
MTVKDYIVGKFQSFGVNISEADLLDITQEGGKEITLDNMREIQIAILKFIPSLLLRPQSISESGFSISRSQSDDIRAYYDYQCKELGIENQLNSSIIDATNLW